MKRLLIWYAVFCCSFFLSASEAEIKAANAAYYQAVQDFETLRALSFIHPDFSELRFGKPGTSYSELAKESQKLAALKKALAPEAKIADIMEFQFLAEGITLDAGQRRQLLALENSPEGKELRKQLQPMLENFKKLVADNRKVMQDIWKSYREISCKADGDQGVLVYQIKNLTDGEMVLNTTTWRKVDGKWLAYKTVIEKLK